MENIKDKILDHDRKLNIKEIEKLIEISKKLEELNKKIGEFQDYVTYLQKFNEYEIEKSPLLKENEIEIIDKMISIYIDILPIIKEIITKLLEYKKLVKEEYV